MPSAPQQLGLLDPAPRRLEGLWNRHGTSLYALACALVGDEAAATRVVTSAMTDLAQTTDTGSARSARRSLARRVYRHSREVVDGSPTTPHLPQHLPPAMLWLRDLVELQRACLALCVFGGHTHREAAGLLGVPPLRVAELLTEGLRELSRSTAVEATTAAH